MGTRMRRLPVVTAMAFAVVILPAGQAGLPISAADGTDEASVGEAVRFRGAVGFRSGRDFVAGTFSDPAYSSVGWSVPLSKAEADELARRSRVQLSLDEAFAFAQKQSRFAGAYIDNSDQGRPTFLFTGGVEAFRDDLARRLPDGLDFGVRRVDHSWDDLQATKKAISADRDQLAAAGIDVTLIGQQVRKNIVVVGIMEVTEEARQRLGEYGDNVTAFRQTPGLADACNGVGDCAPTKSGIKILAEEEGFFCTAGYLANRTDVNPDQKVIITAGHCLQFSGPPNPQEWRHGTCQAR